MKFLDFFAGIGGFRRGMELVGHKCIGFCEFDKYAVMSYTSMHLITEEQRKYLATLDLKARQKEILKDEYRNGEWYANDVRTVDAGSMPKSDCWCFGFPCQDISTNGKMLGFSGQRSSLFFEVMRLLDERKENGLSCPRYLFIENVKNLLSVNSGFDFAKVLFALDERGYDAEWSVLDSQDFGVPQHRERCFIIGHLRGSGGSAVFPVGGKTEDRKDGSGIRIVGRALYSNSKDGQKTPIIDSNGLCPTLMATQYKEPPRVYIKRIGYAYNDPNGYKSQAGRIYSLDGICPTLKTPTGGGSTPFISDKGMVRSLTPKETFRLQGWTDEYYERAAFVCSNSQLYRQAGNGVTVNVIKAMAERMQA